MTDKLVFETDIFRDECIKICRDNIEPIINNSIKELEKRMIDETKNNIQKKIGCQDMYDYSEFEEIKEFLGISIDCKNINVDEIIEKIIKEFNCLQIDKYTYNRQERFENIKKFFEKRIPNEKIILEVKRNHITPEPKNLIYINYFTNYGRRLLIVRCNDIERDFDCCYYEYNFWIPKDYFYILKQFNTCLFNDMIIDILTIMKNILYERKYIPLYAKEIAEENEKLKEEHEKFKKEKIKPYEDIEIERKKIEKEKELLILVRQKLKKESNELKEEKERIEKLKIIFEEEKRNYEICKLDINKILDE
jgi:hypothetical protein